MSREWTEAEEDELRNYMLTRVNKEAWPVVACNLKLNRYPQSINKRWKILQTVAEFTEEEQKLIVEYHGQGYSMDEISDKFPGHTLDAIKTFCKYKYEIKNRQDISEVHNAGSTLPVEGVNHMIIQTPDMRNFNQKVGDPNMWHNRGSSSSTQQFGNTSLGGDQYAVNRSQRLQDQNIPRRCSEFNNYNPQDTRTTRSYSFPVYQSNQNLRLFPQYAPQYAGNQSRYQNIPTLGSEFNSYNPQDTWTHNLTGGDQYAGNRSQRFQDQNIPGRSSEFNNYNPQDTRTTRSYSFPVYQSNQNLGLSPQYAGNQSRYQNIPTLGSEFNSYNPQDAWTHNLTGASNIDQREQYGNRPQRPHQERNYNQQVGFPQGTTHNFSFPMDQSNNPNMGHTFTDPQYEHITAAEARQKFPLRFGIPADYESQNQNIVPGAPNPVGTENQMRSFNAGPQPQSSQFVNTFLEARQEFPLQFGIPADYESQNQNIVPGAPNPVGTENQMRSFNAGPRPQSSQFANPLLDPRAPIQRDQNEHTTPAGSPRVQHPPLEDLQQPGSQEGLHEILKNFKS